MRVGIAIDVSTDVSPEFVAAHAIRVLPSTIHFGDHSLAFDRDPARALSFYRDELPQLPTEAETTPLSVREIERLFLQELVLDYDYVFLITLTRERSRTFEHAHQASFTILQRYPAVRAAHKVEGPFALRVLDSQSLFAGPGVLAWEAARLVRERCTPVEIRARLDALVPDLHAYVVPRDLGYLRARAARRGGQPAGWLSFLLAQALDLRPIVQTHRGASRLVARARGFESAVERLFTHAAGRVARGLSVPMIGISYGGDPDIVPTLPGYAALAAAAQAHGVELMCSMMAPPAAVNVGGGCLSLAYCGDPGEFDASR